MKPKAPKPIFSLSKDEIETWSKWLKLTVSSDAKVSLLLINENKTVQTISGLTSTWLMSICAKDNVIPFLQNVYQTLFDKHLVAKAANKDSYVFSIKKPVVNEDGDETYVVYLPHEFTQYLGALFSHMQNPANVYHFAMMDREFDEIKYMANDTSTLNYNFFDLHGLPEIQFEDSQSSTPTYDSFMDTRFYTEEDRKFFMAWIYSVFDGTTSIRQIVNLYDPEGFSGRSEFVSSFFNIPEIAKISAGISENSITSNFPYESVLGKRLITYPEGVFTDRILSTLKPLTGGDLLTVTRKGIGSALVKSSKAMILSSSNQLPEFNTFETSIRNRIVNLHWVTNKDLIKAMTTGNCKVNRGESIYDLSNQVKKLKTLVEFDAEGNPVIVNTSLKYKNQNVAEGMKREFKHFLAKCKKMYMESSVILSSIQYNQDYTQLQSEEQVNFTNVLHTITVPEAKMKISAKELLEGMNTYLSNKKYKERMTAKYLKKLMESLGYESSKVSIMYYKGIGFHLSNCADAGYTPPDAMTYGYEGASVKEDEDEPLKRNLEPRQIEVRQFTKRASQ